MLGTGTYVLTLSVVRLYEPLGNSILHDLKAACAEEPGNHVFWDEVKKRKADLGLITASEAARHGGRSKVLDSKAEEVRYPISRQVRLANTF
jgi:hypothetical protein